MPDRLRLVPGRATAAGCSAARSASARSPPPELQGQRSGGCERTPQPRPRSAWRCWCSTCCSWAATRSPAATSGQGDMPVEQAIKEGRFAYGPHADRVQMTPPPHSLRLSQVPEEIAGLFERAFRQPGGPHARPTATDWLHALERLKGSMWRARSAAPHVRGERVRLSVVRHRPRRRSRSLRVGAGAGRSRPGRPLSISRCSGATSRRCRHRCRRGHARKLLAEAGAVHPRGRDGLGVGYGDGRGQCGPALLLSFLMTTAFGTFAFQMFAAMSVGPGSSCG